MGVDDKVEISQEKLPFLLKIESTSDQAYNLLVFLFSDTLELQNFLDERAAPHNETPASLRSFIQSDSFKEFFAEQWNSQRNPQDWPNRTPREAFTEAAVKAANSIFTQASFAFLGGKLPKNQYEQILSQAQLIGLFIPQGLGQFQS